MRQTKMLYGDFIDVQRLNVWILAKGLSRVDFKRAVIKIFFLGKNWASFRFYQFRLMEIKKKITHRYLRFLRSLNASGGTLVSLLLSRYLNWCIKKVSKNNRFTLRRVPMSTLLMRKTFTSNSLLIHSQSEKTNRVDVYSW